MTKPGETGKPARMSSPRWAPFSPAYATSKRQSLSRRRVGVSADAVGMAMTATYARRCALPSVSTASPQP